MIRRPSGSYVYVYGFRSNLRRRIPNVWYLLSLGLGRHSGEDGVVPGAGYHQVKVAAPRAVTPTTQPLVDPLPANPQMANLLFSNSRYQD